MRELKTITQAEFDHIYDKHQLFLEGKENGELADLSFTDLSNILILERANLIRAILIRANLREANLREANLLGANLGEADLREANLIRANLFEARLFGADLTGADLESKNKSNPIDNYDSLQQKKILDLEKELEILKKASESDTKLIEEKNTELGKLRSEKKNRNNEINIGLKNAFTSLERVGDDIKPEINRLNVIFYSFSVIAILFFIALFFIWMIALCRFHYNQEKVDFSALWIYAVPSSILIGFIWASIIQMNRAQRQLVSLRKYNRKYNVTKSALEGYYSVENEIDKKPDKAKEVFNEIIKLSLTENIDIDKEEMNIILNSSKDQVPIKEFVDKLIEYLQKLNLTR